MSKRALPIVVVVALASLLASAQASAFEIKDFDVTYTNQLGEPVTQAGSHPYAMKTVIDFSTKPGPKPGEEVQDGAPKDLSFAAPAGLVGDRMAVPRCSDADFLFVDVDHPTSNCPDKSVVGYLGVRTPGATLAYDFSPAYNLAPPPGVAAKIGFVVLHVPVTVLIRVNPNPPHNLLATVKNTTNVEPIGGTELIIWGNPADPAHDSERGKCFGTTGLSCPVGGPVRPFLTLPRACNGPLTWQVQANTWEEPAVFDEASSETALTTSGCDQLGFGPEIAAQPTSQAAESPSGLDFELSVSDPGLLAPAANADSDIKKATVTLPEGLTTNSAVASGLGACTLAQYESETLSSDPGTGCPEAAKVGSLEVESPLLEGEVLGGSIYVAKQGDNPFANLLTLYMVIKNPEVGVLVGAAGKVEPNPLTGQLTTTFDDLPQLPFSHFRFHFNSGERAPLITPPLCATYTTTALLYPYTNPTTPLPQAAEFKITTGPGGAPCPANLAERPNAPSFSAGTLNPKAATYSPFVFRLNREDGSQHLKAITTALPKGLIGKLAGIATCSDAQIAVAASRTGEGQGALEAASPSCPPNSLVGTVTVGAGAGPKPYYVSGKAYLAGPYKNAPLSLEIITPALAGPFDLGVVAVRTALNVNPESAQINAVSDPLPTILHGLPLDVRSVALAMNRPNFTLNPTNCEPAAITGTATSVLGSVAPLSSYFQASDCGALAFKPGLKLMLKGGTKRNRNPQLTATLTYPAKGTYANVARAQAALPHSAFLDQSHFKTICTRVQFAADQCPKGAVYGKAKAISPLLDAPLQGPVYLRSSSHPLPDLVADLRGQIDVVLVGRIDSVNGGIRTTFEGVPDAPVSKFVLSMQGGEKGLLVNSENLCRTTNRAKVRFVAQNGKVRDLSPVVENGCAGGKGSSKR